VQQGYAVHNDIANLLTETGLDAEKLLCSCIIAHRFVAIANILYVDYSRLMIRQGAT